MDREATLEFVKKYTADILSFFGENADIEVSVRDDVIEVNVPIVTNSSILIGRGAETLRSIQFMISTVLRNKGAALQRVNLDIADYKKQRADRLAVKAKEWARRVVETGEARREALNPADRRIVHQAVSDIEGVQTYSEGEGRDRAIVIAPAK